MEINFNLHEGYAQEHSYVATNLCAEWPDRIGHLLSDQFQLIWEECYPQLQVDIVQYFFYSIRSFIESNLTFLLK